jgi:hypothetical protein
MGVLSAAGPASLGRVCVLGCAQVKECMKAAAQGQAYAKASQQGRAPRLEGGEEAADAEGGSEHALEERLRKEAARSHSRGRKAEGRQLHEGEVRATRAVGEANARRFW